MKPSYLRVGEGKDMVFLHGYLASKESFSPQIAYFSRRYRITAPDFPGMGGAGALEEAWSVDDYADWTAQTLSSLGVENAHVVAHSFGGRVAVKLLSRGYFFDRAVLTGCAGVVPKRTLAYQLRVHAYRAVKKIAPRFADRRFGSAEYRTLSPVMRESYKKIVNEDLLSAAERITRPVLFVAGAEDRETPVSSARAYVSRVAGSRLCIMEGCGHFAHLEAPLSFNLAAEEFFSDVSYR